MASDYHKLLLFLALTLSGGVLIFTSCTHSARNQDVAASRQSRVEIAKALNAKDYAKAQTLAAEVTRKNPEFAEPWVGYGMASVRLGQIDRAHQAYERALSLYQTRHRQHPAEANPVVQQIFLLELLGRSREAGSLLKFAQTNYPNNRQVMMWTTHRTELKSSFESLEVPAK